MTNQEKLRKLSEACVCNFEFNKYTTKDMVQKSYYQMKTYFAKTDAEKELVDILYKIIANIYKKEKVDLSKYSDKQLLEIVHMIEKEENSGSYIYDYGITWYGFRDQYEEIEKLEKIIKYNRMSSSDKFKEQLLNGEILGNLKRDFPKMEITDESTYMEYIRDAHRRYASNCFAKLGNYKLEIVCTGLLDMESMLNSRYGHLKLNKMLGFRVVNFKKGNILKVEKYSDLKRIFGAIN